MRERISELREKLASIKLVKFYAKLPRYVPLILLGGLVIVGLYLYTLPGKEYNKLYTYYFEAYYQQFIKKHHSAKARIYADHYARYYATYFTSDEYYKSLTYALPEFSSEAVAYPPGPIASYNINDSGLELIKSFEGFRSEPYRDVGGKLTIGYGHLMRSRDFFSSVTKEQAEEILRQDVKIAEAIVKRNIQVPLTENQFAALVSLAYNIGDGQFSESTLVQRLNYRQFQYIPAEFIRWVHVEGEQVEGLRRRREAEVKLFKL